MDLPANSSIWNPDEIAKTFAKFKTIPDDRHDPAWSPPRLDQQKRLDTVREIGKQDVLINCEYKEKDDVF